MYKNAYKFTIKQLQKHLFKKDISCTEIVNLLLHRIETLDKKIHSFLSIDPQHALQQAQVTDKLISKGYNPGPLTGVTVAIKDNICTLNTPTTCASQMLKNFLSPYEAYVVTKIKSAGGIILGKTNMDEFAMGSSCENSSFFPTYNPWNYDFSPGGSSGGSAAAVAAGLSCTALGSDTGGSIRLPASLCGIVGIKPTYGRVSRYGLTAFGSSLEQIGPLARSVEDAALLLEVISGHDANDATCIDHSVPKWTKNLCTQSKGIHLGVLNMENTETEVANHIALAIENLIKAGVTIKEIKLPHLKYALAAYCTVAFAEASSNLSRFDGIRYGKRSNAEIGNVTDLYNKNRKEGLGPEVKRRILLGAYVLSNQHYSRAYEKALKVRTVIQREIEDALKTVDAFVTPTSLTAGIKLGSKTDPLDMYLSDIATVPFNLSGHPAISIPCGKNSQGLPIGMQIVGRIFDEQTILNLAYTYERQVEGVELPELE